MHPRIRNSFRLHLTVLALTTLFLPGCMLVSSRPVVIPPPLPPATLSPGDRLFVLAPESAGVDEPLLELVVAADGTVELPGIGPMPVDGYCPDDLAAVLLSVQPDLGAVRVECLGPAAPAAPVAMEASAPHAPAGR